MHIVVQERPPPTHKPFPPTKRFVCIFLKNRVQKKGSEKGRERGDVNIGIQKPKIVEKLIFRALQALCTPNKYATNILDLHYPFHYPFSTTFGVVNHQ